MLDASPLRSRTAFFIRGFTGGGAQKDAILLANALQEIGRPAALVTLHDEGPLRALVSPDVAVVDLGRGGRLRMALAAPALRHALKAGRPDVFVASEAAGNALAVLATRGLRGTRLVLREVVGLERGRRDDPYAQNRLAYRLAPLLYPRADLVLALTEAGRAELGAALALRPDRLRALGSNAVLTDAMLARIEATPRAAEPGLIVTTSRLSLEKGVDLMIEALALVRTPGARLLVLGDGPQRVELEALVAQRGLDGRVTLAGFEPDPLGVLARASLFLSASRHEGLGNAIIEALAVGVPVVSTDAPHGPREILRGGELGALTPVGDAPALAAAIDAALAAPHDPEPGRARARDFTAKAAAQAFAAILDGMRAGSQTSP